MKVLRLLLLAARLCGTFAVCGCSSRDEPATPTLSLAPPAPLPECPDADYSPCDIREGSCQRQLGDLAACLREDAPLATPIDVMTEAEYLALLRQEAEGSSEPPVKHFNRAISKLGLAPLQNISYDDQLETRVANLGGVYRPEEKRIIIIDRERTGDRVYDDIVLVHELVHALQDADHDLLHWPDDEPTTFDSGLAHSTLVEGEAKFYEYRASVPLLGLDLDDVDLEVTLQENLERSFEQALSAELLMSESYATVTYGMGAVQTLRVWNESGPRGMDPLWASPPRTMQRIMSELFGLNTPQDRGIDIAAPEIEALAAYDDTTLGAWGLYLVLAKAGEAQPLERSLTWRGDHLWVFEDGDAATYALWQLELESSEAAQDLDAFFGRLANVRHRSSAERVYASYAVGPHDASPELSARGEVWLEE
jgi:hypothetical protein